MENVVSIIKSRDNELEFDISIQGVNDEGTQVRFVIDANPAALVFACTHKEDDKWVVNVPPMPQMEAKSYDFHIEIVVSGYFFTPFKGTINVTNEPEVKSSGVSAPVVAPVVGAIKVNGEAAEEKEMKAEEPTKAEKKETKVVVDAEEEEVEKKEDKKTKPLPDEYQDLADQLIKKHKEKQGKETEQGKKVKEVLKSIKKEEKKPEPKKEEPKKAEVKETPKKVEPKKEEKKPEPKEKKVKESAPIIPRRSNLSAAIEDFKKPPELSEQAKKVQDILKTLH